MKMSNSHHVLREGGAFECVSALLGVELTDSFAQWVDLFYFVFDHV